VEMDQWTNTRSFRANLEASLIAISGMVTGALTQVVAIAALMGVLGR
jgi:hypothetical protein